MLAQVRGAGEGNGGREGGGQGLRQGKREGAVAVGVCSSWGGGRAVRGVCAPPVPAAPSRLMRKSSFATYGSQRKGGAFRRLKPNAQVYLCRAPPPFRSCCGR